MAMYIDAPKPLPDRLIHVVLRIVLGLFVGAFALTIEVGLFARRGGSYFAEDFIDSGAQSLAAFLISYPGYLVFPIMFGILAGLFPAKVGKLLIRSGQETNGYW